MGIGDRADLTVTIPYGNHSIRTVAEAKTINNVEVDTALREQLVERYLRPLALRHGLYLVYWVRRDRRPPGWHKSRGEDRDSYLDELRAQADAVRVDGFHVVPYILDISPPPT
ncbi:hypothetical protein [Pseudonocardia sp. HH130630-07]|uniref:hypothetical protein n=1 Tax=Pseudonocardia sp. HH130630-07 TaxID=1690815 RepID=UPI0012EA38F2|nr:hypothetical protein [Pseudonocardia sp. HH130630-07]